MQTQPNTDTPTAAEVFELRAPVDLQALGDEAFAQYEADAHATLARFERIAKDSEATARQAAEAFERSPDAEALAAREVKAQVAKNHRATAASFAESMAPLLAEATRRKQMRRFSDLHDAVQWRPEVDAAIARIDRLYADFASRLGTEIEIICRALERNNAAADEYNGLERRFGLGRPHAGAVKLVHVISIIRGALHKRFGTGYEHDVEHGAQFGMANSGTSYWLQTALKFKPSIHHSLRG